MSEIPIPPQPQEAWQFRPAMASNSDGNFLVLPNDCLGRHLLKGLRWEEHITKLIQAVVKPGQFVLDIGANIGYTSAILARQVGPQGHVIAVEPLRLVYHQLCANLFLNGLSNVLPLHLAMGHQSNIVISMQKVDYHQDGINIMDSAIGTGGEEVVMQTVDALNLSRLDFVKLDVQGAELFVLQGAKQTIEKYRPLMTVEIEARQLERFGLTAVPVIELLWQMGYLVLLINNDFPVDCICLPKERRAELEFFQKLFPIKIIE
jgi:FkbM family methyltransferase